MSHRYHPAQEDNPAAILFDDCDDCRLHVNHMGLNLTSENFANMWDLMVQVETGGQGTRYRSNCESDLGKMLYRQYVALERFTTIDPKMLFAPWKLV